MITIDFRSLKLLILEDSIKYAKVLDGLLLKLEITKTEIAYSYKEAIDLFTDCRFDLLLVDIDLGKHRRSGDDFVRFVRKQQSDVPVIYLTSHYKESFYEKIKDTKPSSFLSKNVSCLGLRQAIELSLNNNNTEKLADSPPQFDPDNYFIKVGNVYKAIHIKDISYIYAKDKATFIHIDGRDYPMNRILKDLEVSFSKHNFCRVHKTYLVNMNKINGIDTQNHKLQVENKSIPIGYIYRKKLFRQLTLLK